MKAIKTSTYTPSHVWGSGEYSIPIVVTLQHPLSIMTLIVLTAWS